MAQLNPRRRGGEQTGLGSKVSVSPIASAIQSAKGGTQM